MNSPEPVAADTPLPFDPPPPQPPLPLLTVDQLWRLPKPSWLIDRYLPADALVLLYGTSGSFKSFLALAWALSVAAGTPWHGRRVKQRPVVWIAAEAVTGLAPRIAAWAKRHPGADLGAFRVVPQAVNLLIEEEVEKLVDTLDSLLNEPGLVVIDTLAASMIGGEENAGSDMGQVIAALRAYRARTGATILLVHHSGKKGGAERGHSSLRCAADTIVRITRKPKSPVATLECEQHRDHPESEPLRLRAIPVADSLVLTDVITPARGATSEERPHTRVVKALTDKPSLNRTDLVKALGGNAATARAMIDAAVADPSCPVHEERVGRKRLCKLAESSHRSRSVAEQADQ